MFSIPYSMKIAVEGCAHGELDKIYEAIQHMEKDGVKIDLLICCGDFQSTRNVHDLRCMAVPQKYQKMCSFYKYYSGEKVAPILTIFIGGNHEASNYLQELAYGGWVAPRIYYMGYASVINVAGVRIGGLSGIYKGHDYMKGHFEKPPYTEETKRSAYHVRNLEIFRLKQCLWLNFSYCIADSLLFQVLRSVDEDFFPSGSPTRKNQGLLDLGTDLVQQPIQIFISHDWPRGVYNHGEKEKLLKCKPFFTKEVKENVLGSKPCEELLYHLKPTFWFAAHLHVKFAALVPHIAENELKQTTKFLALDKCLPKRRFLQVVEVPHDPEKSIELEYDLEWLSILYLTNHLLSVKKSNQYMPGPGMESRWDFKPTKEEMEFVSKKYNGNLTIPQNFTQTVAPYQPDCDSSSNRQPHAQINPQTMSFCDRLNVDDPMGLLLNSSSDSSESSQNEMSTSCNLPSYMTPEREGDTTYASHDNSYNELLSDSMELEIMSRKHNTLISLKECSSTNILPRRLSLALPSPQNSDVDEPMKTTEEIGGSSSCIQSFRLSLPSPKDSDIDEPSGSAETISSRTSSTDSEAVSDSSPDLQPKLKRFKRRNHSLYSNSEDDG
ncbi:Lariat debranching enzyme [Blattella germanica]|nr:Lariat debranching enzyme [Blattella germanica]